MADLNPNLRGLAPSGGTGPLTLEPAPEAQPFTDAQVDDFREQDRWLPIANVARIMKNSLPASAKVSKESKECVQECVSEYISFITSEAADKCLNEKRKTINGEDILTSLRALGFDNYEEVLKVYLSKYREHQMSQMRQKLGGGTGDEVDDGVGKRAAEQDDEDVEGDAKRRKKKAGKK